MSRNVANNKTQNFDANVQKHHLGVVDDSPARRAKYIPKPVKSENPKIDQKLDHHADQKCREICARLGSRSGTRACKGTICVSQMIPLIDVSKSVLTLDKSQRTKIDTKIRPPCGPEMLRNRVVIELQNCHPSVQKHQLGGVNDPPDRQPEIWHQTCGF